MTARVLIGSKQEIAQQVVSLEGEVREAIVFVQELATVPPPPEQSDEDIFAEMEQYMVDVDNVDYSREGIYPRKPGE